jgi:hypothetical protein
MAEFLSAEWLLELDRAARASDVLAEIGESPLVVEQRVHDAPGGEVAYHVIIDEHGARVIAGRATAPDVTLSTDFEMAAALHRGDTNAQQALTAGRLKVGGRIAKFVRRSDAFDALNDVFASVRTTTTGTARDGTAHR